MKSNFIITAYALVLVSFGYFATDIYLPSLPALAEYFEASEVAVQMTLFSYMLSFSLTPLILGPFSDNIGRKKMIIIGLFVSLMATIGCYFSANIYSLIAFRLIQGAGAGGVMISARAMIPDLFKGKDLAKRITYITMFMPLVLSCAPAIGGYIQEAYGWQAVFLFLIGYIVLILIKMTFFSESLKESSGKKISEYLPIYRELLKNKLFVHFALGLVIPSFGMFAYLAASPILFQDLMGLSPSEYGLLSLYIGGGIMTASFLNTRLLKYFPITGIIWLGSGLMTTGGLLMLIFHLLGVVNMWALLLPAILYFSCLPLSMGNSASISMGFIKKDFGAATALQTSVQFMSASLGILLFSLIPETSTLPLAICFLSVAALFMLNFSYALRLRTENA